MTRSCVGCSVVFEIGVGQGKKVRCETCAAQHKLDNANNYRKKRRADARSRGLCGTCATRPAAGGARCPECREQQNAAPSHRKTGEGQGVNSPKNQQRIARYKAQRWKRLTGHNYDPVFGSVTERDWNEIEDLA